MTPRSCRATALRGRRLEMLGLFLFLFLVPKLAAAEQVFGAEPGARSSAHRWIPHCDQCHVSQHVLSDAKCLSCHEPIQKRIAWGHGLHSYGYKQGLSCFRCHREHRGASSDISGWAAIGGVNFDHAITDFPLQGKHASAPSDLGSSKTCQRCHSRAPQHYDPPSPLCGNANCHKRDDAHFGTLGQRCNRCHLDGSTFKRPVFNHNDPKEPDRFALIG